MLFPKSRLGLILKCYHSHSIKPMMAVKRLAVKLFVLS